LVSGETIVCAFKTVRDQLIFTDRRLISIDVMGVTGKKKSFTSLPYSRVQYFTVQTPGFAEIFPDSELVLYFSNGHHVRFEFSGSVDIGKLGRVVSHGVC
jgi:hypothetical protein